MKPALRVLLLADRLSTEGGGDALAAHLLALAPALAAAGAKVGLALPLTTALTQPVPEGVTLLPLPAVSSEATLRALHRWAPDVVHVHRCEQLHLLSELQTLDVPLVRSIHDHGVICLRDDRRRWPGDRCTRSLGLGCLAFGCTLTEPPTVPQGGLPGGLRRLNTKRAALDFERLFDRVLVSSESMRKLLLANRFHPAPLRVMPGCSRFDGSEAATVQRPPGRPGQERPLALLYAGGAQPAGGLPRLLQALDQLPASWHLTVLTAEAERPAIYRLLPRLDRAASVALRSLPRDGVPAAAYRAADLLVLPSTVDDPRPSQALDAMALGTPVLASPSGLAAELIRDGLNGFLCDADTVRGLGDALRRALERGADLADIGRAAQHRVLASHSPARHAEALLAVYREAAEPWGTLQQDPPAAGDWPGRQTERPTGTDR